MATLSAVCVWRGAGGGEFKSPSPASVWSCIVAFGYWLSAMDILKLSAGVCRLVFSINKKKEIQKNGNEKRMDESRISIE